MKILKSLILLLASQLLICAQQPTPKSAPYKCRGCVHKASKRTLPPASTSAGSTPAEYFVGEARVDVTKDETVVRLAMAQHGSILIELPANDGPRYIIPGDPEMATVDQKALERNKRAIVVRPGTQFVPPLRNQKTRTPSATVTAQMRSGLVVTFLFYPVEDLAQNVHRCVLNYNRDEVVARRRAAGLPVNLDGTGERGEMTTQSAAPTSIAVEDKQEEAKAAENASPPIPTAAPQVNQPSMASSQNAPEPPSYVFSARTALQDAMKQPKRFKKWTKPTHGLSLSILEPSVNAEQFSVVLVAVKNKTSEPVKLSPNTPELFIEMLDAHGKPLNIESIKKLHTEASDTSGLVSKGAVVYYAVAYRSPVLNVHQQLRVSVAQTRAADEPASIVLARSENRGVHP
jgi:hypothetical protein